MADTNTLSPFLQAVPVVGGVLSGIAGALGGSAQRQQQERQAAIENALRQAQLAEEQRQADMSNQVSRYNAGENTRQFNVTTGQKAEGTNFDRTQQARYAAVRAPLIAGLMGGQNLRGTNNPGMARYASMQTPTLNSRGYIG
jgi:hypothetical protein